jgi:hypothetical protein
MPGLLPSFCPIFPEAFLQQARDTVGRKTAPHQAVQRSQLALLLHQEPHVGHAQAGQRVGLSASQVRRWRKRWAAGDFSLADAAGRGRKATFSPAGPCLGQSRGL